MNGYFACKDMYDKTFHKYEISVSTGDLQWIVSKRYKEFDAFHSSLREAWQALNKSQRRDLRPLPKMPPKKIIGSTKTRFLIERQKGLGRFLSLLAVHPWASEHASFLSFTGMLSDTRTSEAAEGRNVIHLSRILDFVKVSHILVSLLRLITFFCCASSFAHFYPAHATTPSNTYASSFSYPMLYQPGDVVLFQSANKLAGLQRGVTWSEWDHSALSCSRHK